MEGGEKGEGEVEEGRFLWGQGEGWAFLSPWLILTPYVPGQGEKGNDSIFKKKKKEKKRIAICKLKTPTHGFWLTGVMWEVQRRNPTVIHAWHKACKPNLKQNLFCLSSTSVSVTSIFPLWELSFIPVYFLSTVIFFLFSCNNLFSSSPERINTHDFCSEEREKKNEDKQRKEATPITEERRRGGWRGGLLLCVLTAVCDALC